MLAYLSVLDFLQLIAHLFLIWLAWSWVSRAESPVGIGRKVVFGLLVVFVLIYQGRMLYVANAMAEEANAKACNPLSYTWDPKKCSE